LIFHGGHFCVDGDHRAAETVQFVFRFAFGRFDPERAGDGPWSMSACAASPRIEFMA